MLDSVLFGEQAVVLDYLLSCEDVPCTQNVVLAQSVESIIVLFYSDVAVIIFLTHQIQSVIFNSWDDLDLLVVSEVDNSLRQL